MKIPLRFQITEFDCGTVALQNAISYLFDRENVPPELIRAVSIYTVNCYDDVGNIVDSGVTHDTMEKMTTWITEYVNHNSFGITCTHLEKGQVDINAIKMCLSEGGCAFVKTFQNGDSFAVVTKIDDNFVYLWDAYYQGETYYDNEKQVTIIFNKPFHYNRQVSLRRFLSDSANDFALGPIENRDCVLFNKIKL